MMPPRRSRRQPGTAGGGGEAARPASDPAVGQGEFRSSDDRRTGYLAGITAFGVKRVEYSVVGGLAIFEGDIVLGHAETVQKVKTTADSTGVLRDVPASGGSRPTGTFQQGVAIVGERYRWPHGVIPYEVQPEIEETVSAAIQHWEEHTGIRFVARGLSNASAYPNYVSFEMGEGCGSFVGMQTGKQSLSLGLGCQFGQAVHEIGHAVGLWHEQSREDRDQFVRIAWENIQPNREQNFNQHITDGDDIGEYDFASIMHYPADAFSATGLPTIVTLGGQPIGQRTGLSPGDIAAVAAMYPGIVGGGGHFYTASLIELQNAVTNFGYRNDGVICYVAGAPIPGATPLLRLSNPQGDFLYTTSTLEAYYVVANQDYSVDGVTCYVFPTPLTGLTPLYRLGKKQPSDHLYTTSLTEVYQAVTHFGYEAQGIAGHVLSTHYAGLIPLYQLSRAA